MTQAEREVASPFFLDHAQALRSCGALGPVLDVACGSGRHALAAASLGVSVVALDRDPSALASLRQSARSRQLPVHPVRCDLEVGPTLPLASGCFGAVLVFRFLWRPLAPALAASLRPGGLLLYETFTRRQQGFAAGPRNPDFLLEEGELPALFTGLERVSYEELVLGGERPQALARLCARRPLG